MATSVQEPPASARYWKRIGFDPGLSVPPSLNVVPPTVRR